MTAELRTLSTTDRERLIQAAIEAKDGAYAPYSKFRVGAAFLTPDGRIVKGANVENASYGGTICAERTAIVKAVVGAQFVQYVAFTHIGLRDYYIAQLEQSEGIRSFVALAVNTDVAQPLSPCGICRQVIREFCALKMPILLVPSGYASGQADNSVDLLETTVEGLLPYSFGPDALELPRTG